MDTETILERRRLRRRASFWRFAAFAVLALAIVAVIGIASDFDRLQPVGSRGQIAEIRLDGFIETRPETVEVIDQAARDEAVRAILLHIDSGGGAASGGEALYRAIRDASEEKPVVAVIDGIGASGAYMAAIAADRIVAAESAITGSIGVIFQYPHFEELIARIGIDYEEVRSGPMKGEPSLFREPSPGAEEMIRAVVDDSYDWFVGLVAERRGLPPQEARRIADGSIYTGRQALELKLVDELGGADEARAWLAAEKGVSEDLPVFEWKKDEPFFPLFASSAIAGLASLIGLDASGAALLPRRLTVDGLLSVWQPSASGRSDR